MNFEIDGDVLFENDLISVKRPDTDSSGWTVVEEESIEYSKGDYILEAYNAEFPDLKLSSYDELCKVASRSKALNMWLLSANINYADSTQLPLFAEGLISPKSFKKLTSDVQKVKEVVRRGASRREKAAVEYKALIEKLEKEENEELSKLKKGNQILTILTISSQLLPLSLQLSIEGYKSVIGSSTIEESRKVYAREVLIQYKKALLEAYIADNNLNIEEIISKNALK